MPGLFERARAPVRMAVSVERASAGAGARCHRRTGVFRRGAWSVPAALLSMATEVLAPRFHSSVLETERA